MSKKGRSSVPRGEQRRGYYGGVYGTSYAYSGGLLNPSLFGYTTAQGPVPGAVTTIAPTPAAVAAADTTIPADAGAAPGGAPA